MFRSFGLLILVNFAIMFTLIMLTNLLGLNHYLTNNGINYQMLMGFCLVYGMGGAFFSLMISKQMAKWTMGLQVLDAHPSHPAERALVEMVKKLSHGAGLPMPEVAIYPSPEVNAFATGPSRSNSLVAVSTGLLNVMDQAEVEGVLAHEVSHIANGDMVTMTLLQGIMNAFVMFVSKALAWVIASSMSQDRDREESRPSYFLVWAIEMGLYMVFGMLAGLVVAWFSRRREFSADRDGARLAGRGKMIAALERLQRMHEAPTSAMAEAASPQAFDSLKISGRTSWLELFSTHPPLAVRIQRLKER